MPDQVRDCHKPFLFQYKRIRPGQKSPLNTLWLGQPLQSGSPHSNGVCTPKLCLPQVTFHIFKGGHSEFEWQIVIERTEFTFVMGTACCYFKQQRGRLIRWPPYCSSVVHSRTSISFFAIISWYIENKSTVLFCSTLIFNRKDDMMPSGGYEK